MSVDLTNYPGIADVVRYMKSIWPASDWNTIAVAPYTEAHRHYHGLDHIEYMLESVDDLCAFYQYGTWPTLKIATLFHDVIYDVAPNSHNEERSAVLFRAVDKAGYDPAYDLVYRAILDTQTHKNPSSWLAACLIDADLAGLGAVDGVYAKNTEKVKAEFLQVCSEEEFYRGRYTWLRSFMARPVIYCTSWGSQFEEAARVNMEFELLGIEKSFPQLKE